MQLDELRQGLQEIATRTPSGDAGARSAVLQRGRHLVRRRRYEQTGMALIVGAVLVAGVVAVRSGQHEPTTHTIVTSPSTSTPTFATSPTGIETLPSPRLTPRSGEAVVWTGTNLVVWGGYLDAANSGVPGPDHARNDGSFYSPTTHRWTPMSPSPLPATRDDSVGAPTDDGVVFTRGRETALWNPTTNTWRKLDDAPGAVTDLTFTGSVVVSCSADATLDVHSGAWRSLPNPPVSLDRQTFTWTGHDLVVIGGPGTPFTSAEAIALDPTQREWRRLPNLPADIHAEALTSGWDGHRIVVVNYDMRAAAYDPSKNTWSTIPPVPARFYEWYPSMTSAGGYTIVFMAKAVVVRTPNDTWVPMPYGDIPFGTIATTRPSFVAQSGDGAVFVYGGIHKDGANTIVRVDPARLVAAASRFQVGVGSVQAPPGYRLTDSHYDLTLEAVDVGLGGPNHAGCSVKSSYTSLPGRNSTPVLAGHSRESLQNDGKATTWYRNSSGTVWQVGPSTSDGFTIECADPTTARALAASASFK